MSYARLSPEQTEALRRHVKGRVVHDLGAGLCNLSVALLDLGAKRVIAIEKEKMPVLDRPGLVQVRASFQDAAGSEDVEHAWGRAEIERAREFVRSIDVAFLSWPPNYPVPGLLDLLERARSVVYVGKNTDSSACGWGRLFRLALIPRRVLAHVPDPKNTLIVYGRVAGPRRLLGEEFAALVSAQEQVVTFEQASAIDAGR